MSKESWFSVIPFINQYPSWAQLVLAICVIVILCVLLFAYPKQSQYPKLPSTQEAQIDKSTNTNIGNIEGDYVNGDKNVYTTPETQESMPKLSSLSFSQITEAIEKAPPLQRDDVKNNYKGIKVTWDSYLKSATKINNNTISLLLATSLKGDLRLFIIRCEVPLNEYRELGILPAESKIRIQGEIAKVDAFVIDLTKVKLFFLDTDKTPTKQ